jgi:glycosyltransferase involved in cell wall biosynthesis
MKVVIAALTAPTNLNGVSRHAANLVRGLLAQPDAPEIHFLAGEWQQRMFGAAIARADSRLHVHWIPLRHNNFSRIRWYYDDLPAVVAQLYADVVHMTCPAPLRARAFGCPGVVSLHDLYPFDIPGNFGSIRSRFTRMLMRDCLMRIDAIACVSAYTQTRLAAWLPPQVCQKALTIPNAVEPLLAGAQRPPDALRGGEPFVLCIAQHRQNKNVPLAIQAFASALNSKALPWNARLLVLGISGPDTPRILAEIDRLHLDRRVILLNGITDPELRWCYRNSLFLFAPSSIEGFGLPIAEALIAGCPVVCSDIPAFREVGGARCRYVAVNREAIDGYIAAFRDVLLLPRPAGASMPEFAPSTIGSRYLELYRRLIGLPTMPQHGILRHPISIERKAEAPVSPV